MSATNRQHIMAVCGFRTRHKGKTGQCRDTGWGGEALCDPLKKHKHKQVADGHRT